jgi:hypothetical protein
MTTEEKEAMDPCDGLGLHCMDIEDVEHLYTDGVARDWDQEAHLFFEHVRAYLMPPIPQDLLDALPRSAETTAPRDTTEPDEEQRWQVSISGYEVDLMDPYWRITTGVWASVRFDYTLHGEFLLEKTDGKWVFHSGRIAYADARISHDYGPQGSWEVRLPLQCQGCSSVTAGRPLTGEVIGDDVKLSWGVFRPKVDVHARIAVSCVPMPACSEWGNRWFESNDFYHLVNDELLPLKEGVAASKTLVDPASSEERIDYTITMRRSDR